VAVKPADCGKCFELVASGAGGVPPYAFEWDDGSQGAGRRVCSDQRQISVSVIARDANAARSTPNVTLLENDADAGCSAPPEPPAKLCVMNASFEGTPSINVGVPETFDGAPWKVCTDPAATASGAPNTPDIGNDSLALGIGNPPKAVDGTTYLALNQGEQVSQALCGPVPVGEVSKFQIDLSRIELTQGDTSSVFLEVWGGIAADCSQRQLLWASPALTLGWKTYCVSLKPLEFMDQITLRGKSDQPMTTALEYLVADNLVPVDDCP
jgi:hypothetical protein